MRAAQALQVMPPIEVTKCWVASSVAGVFTRFVSCQVLGWKYQIRIGNVQTLFSRVPTENLLRELLVIIFQKRLDNGTAGDITGTGAFACQLFQDVLDF